MATASIRAVPQKVLEDPLAHLPRRIPTSYQKGDTIYTPKHRPQSIFLVAKGRVLAYLIGQNDRRFLVDIYLPDDLFGLSALGGQDGVPEHAVAMESCELMAWTVSEIEKLEQDRPKLALALVQMLAQRSLEYGRILAQGPVDYMDSRLARALLRFGERFGSQTVDGRLCLPAISHKILSEHIGTSREIVSRLMNDFRGRGLLRYSRKEITIDRSGLTHWLDRRSAIDYSRR